MRVGHCQASIKNPSRYSYWGFFMPGDIGYRLEQLELERYLSY